ncbi:MAG: hypothetical protein CMN79_05500 [Spirochaetales bacterium]|jgi:N-acetyl sugar amidotransferase|nr:hypothetical protein [Spirochaetales bacterium]
MILFCTKCITPNSRPRIVFNAQNICNACTNSENKKKIDWSNRKEEFIKLVSDIKNRDAYFNKDYDCIVPWSGGKDSTSIALKLKFEFGLNPLLVTFSPVILNECGIHNREELLKKGFDSIFIRPNQKVAKELAKRFFIERGCPKIAFGAGVNAAPLQMAVKMKIPYVMFAEHGEAEYGGLILSEESHRTRNIREVIEHQIGDYPENWVSESISIQDLAPYIYPNSEEIKKNNVKAFYFSYFFRWSILENFKYVKKILPNFMTSPNGRTVGTFTNFDSLDDKIDNLEYYMMYIKFGFGRASRDASRQIQNGQMDRETAISLARKYDDEYSHKDHFKEALEYLDISEFDFEEIVNKHRNSEIWKQHGNSWKLINSI